MASQSKNQAEKSGRKVRQKSQSEKSSVGFSRASRDQRDRGCFKNKSRPTGRRLASYFYKPTALRLKSLVDHLDSLNRLEQSVHLSTFSVRLGLFIRPAVFSFGRFVFNIFFPSSIIYHPSSTIHRPLSISHRSSFEFCFSSSVIKFSIINISMFRVESISPMGQC